MRPIVVMPQRPHPQTQTTSLRGNALFDHCVAFIFVVVMANIKVVFQEGDESSASEGGMILH
jgi:hypothetical protein